MNLLNKVEMKLEDYAKCHLHIDADCPLGNLYDFLCVAQHFVMNKMQESAPKKVDEKPVETPAE